MKGQKKTLNISNISNFYNNTRLVSKITSDTFVNVFCAMKCKNTNGEILCRVHRQHCKNYSFVACTSGEQQYDDDGATVDTRVQLQTSFGYMFFPLRVGKLL